MAGSKRIKKEALWVVTTQLSMVAFYAIGFRYITNEYSPKVYGEFTLLSGILTLVVAIALNPIFAIHVRFYPNYRDKNLLSWFEGRVFRLLLLSLCVLAALGGIASIVWAALTSWDRIVIGGILFATLLGQAAFLLDTNVQSANRRQDRLALLRPLRVIAFPVTALLLASQWTASLPNLLLAAASGYWVSWVISRAIGWQKRKADTGDLALDEDSILTKAMGHYGAPFVVIAVANWVSAVGDRYLLAVNISFAEIGIYAAIYGLFSQPYFMVLGGLSQWLRPVLFDAVAAGDTAKAKLIVKRWVLVGVGLSVVGGAILYFGRSLWLDLLLSEEYHYQGYLILFLLVANSMQVVTSAFSHHLMATKQTSKQVRPLLIAATTNVVANLLLVPHMGIDGAGLATAISFSVHAGIMAWVAISNPLTNVVPNAE